MALQINAVALDARNRLTLLLIISAPSLDKRHHVAAGRTISRLPDERLSIQAEKRSSGTECR